MRKILSIPLVILLIFSGITVNFATHLCHGSVAGIRVSLSAANASCGMENTALAGESGNIIKNHCCDNISAAYSIAGNYFPSAYSVNEPLQQIIHVTYVPCGLLSTQGLFVNISSENIRPPGTKSPNGVDLQILCIFRI